MGSRLNGERTIVIGGGLAGIAAALRLADAGHAPLLLEARGELGGRATSLDDPRTGAGLDNCQHVLMGCCTALQTLYQRLGVQNCVEWHDELHWLREDGGIDSLRADPLPAPLHQTRSLVRMKLLDVRSRRDVARLMWRMIRMGHRGRRAWSERSFGDFLREHGQSHHVIRVFWDTVITSACNLPSDRIAALHGLQVFQEAFLSGRTAGAMGVPNVPLRDLYEPARRILDGAGGEIRLGAAVRAIEFDGQNAVAVATGRDVHRTTRVVSTVPPDALGRLIPPDLHDVDERIRGLDRFRFSPIIGVHLRFHGTVTALPHLILAGRPVHWMFNKGTDPSGRQHLHAVISAADTWMDRSKDEIVDAVLTEFSRAFPEAAREQLVDARVIKERRGTFAATVDVEPLRPGPGPRGLRGLYLAGDWCDTGWPATMEGAVRSGLAAAAAITGGPTGIRDLPAGRLVSLLGLR